MPIPTQTSRTKRGMFAGIWRWLTDDELRVSKRDSDRIDWLRCVPFLLIHLLPIAIIWVGWSPIAIFVAATMYFARMFFITGFYHRYFSHRTYRTSRWFAFVMGFAGCTAGQRGPLWWAAHHRQHHNHSDEPDDPHSPRQVGFLVSHMGWFMKRNAFATDWRYVGDWAQSPELRWLNRFDWLPVVLAGGALFGFGVALQHAAPSLNTSGMQMFIWGFVISTLLLYHGTYTVNSLAHVFGSQRFDTSDDSRNSWVIALITMGEGWHNNHHHYPATAKQGFYWWEVDVTYYLLWLMAKTGLIWDLRPVPSKVLQRRRLTSAKKNPSDQTGKLTIAAEGGT